MKNRPFKIATLALFTLSACINIPPLDCTKDADCTTKTIAGVCVFAEGLPGACGLPDDSCSSGYRYYKDSSAGRSRQCVALPTFDVMPIETSVDEHHIFSVRVVAKDGNGQKFLNYKGTPALSADWGDVREFSFSGFVNGEAQYRVWLNRETTPESGAAHITAQDGPYKGRSGNITVTLPPWTELKETLTVDNIPNVKYLQEFSFVNVDDAFYELWLIGRNEKGTQDLLFSADISSFFGLIVHEEPAVKADRVDDSIDGIYLPQMIYGNRERLLSYLTPTNRSPGNVATATSIFSSSTRSNWILRASPPITVVGEGSDSKGCGPVGLLYSIIWEGQDRYRIFYSNQYGFCTAASSDGGISWHSGTPVVRPPVVFPYTGIIKDGSLYRGWTRDNDQKIKALISSDAINWSVFPTTFQDGRDVYVIWNETEKRYLALQRSGVTDTSITYRIFTRP